MSHKNLRKIIRIGNTSFGVILPKDWLRFYNLSYGDSVEVVSDDTVVIKPIEKNTNEGGLK